MESQSVTVLLPANQAAAPQNKETVQDCRLATSYSLFALTNRAQCACLSLSNSTVDVTALPMK